MKNPQIYLGLRLDLILNYQCRWSDDAYITKIAEQKCSHDNYYKTWKKITEESGGWIKDVDDCENYPELINGVISLHVGFSGKFAKAKNPDQGWINWRNYQISQINWSQLGDVILFTHDKDWGDTRSTLSFLTEFENIKFFNLSDTQCKRKIRLGGYHGIALTKCFANKDIRSKEVINYLNKIY